MSELIEKCPNLDVLIDALLIENVWISNWVKSPNMNVSSIVAIPKESMNMLNRKFYYYHWLNKPMIK